MLLDGSGRLLGGSGNSWAAPGALGRLLSGCWAALARLWAAPGGSGSSWAAFGQFLDDSWAALGRLWAALSGSCAHHACSHVFHAFSCDSRRTATRNNHLQTVAFSANTSVVMTSGIQTKTKQDWSGFLTSISSPLVRISGCHHQHFFNDFRIRFREKGEQGILPTPMSFRTILRLRGFPRFSSGLFSFLPSLTSFG